MTTAEEKGLGEFARQGFTLEHPDDHVVELYHEGEFVARFSQAGPTSQRLQKACARYLKRLKARDNA